MTHGPTPHEERLILAGELGMLAELLPLIATEHLPFVRALLRSRGRWQGATPVQLELIGGLLDRCCRRIIDSGVGDVAYFVGVGDMLPPAPADPSSIEARP